MAVVLAAVEAVSIARGLHYKKEKELEEEDYASVASLAWFLRSFERTDFAPSHCRCLGMKMESMTAATKAVSGCWVLASCWRQLSKKETALSLRNLFVSFP